MNLLRYTSVFCFTLMFLASCVTTQPTPGALSPTPGANQYELTGHYFEDKFYFFPTGRNFKVEHILLQALLEGAEGKLYEPNRAFSPEQNLAIEYDVASYSKDSENLAIVLGKVGRWKESAETFKRASGSNTTSAGLWGNLGVAQYALGNYGESVNSFDKALAINPSYFDSRPNQKDIWHASKEGRTITN